MCPEPNDEDLGIDETLWRCDRSGMGWEKERGHPFNPLGHCQLYVVGLISEGCVGRTPCCSPTQSVSHYGLPWARDGEEDVLADVRVTLSIFNHERLGGAINDGSRSETEIFVTSQCLEIP